jgi:hypothetical protein
VRGLANHANVAVLAAGDDGEIRGASAATGEVGELERAHAVFVEGVLCVCFFTHEDRETSLRGQQQRSKLTMVLFTFCLILYCVRTTCRRLTTGEGRRKN